MARTDLLNLNNGTAIPSEGFGTWQLDGQETIQATTAALKAGYRLIDTAKIYGNEQEVGQAIKASKIPRSEIFVTTKLWTSDQGYDSALSAFSESLERLGLEYIDLYLIHWPGRDNQRRLDSWRALEEVAKTGKSKSIGVSNFDPHHLQELAKHSKTVPAVNQIEFHPFIYNKQAPTLEYCRKHRIIVEAYSPLNRGHDIHNPALAGIAKTNKKSPAQVMLRWAIQHGTVPIPKSAHPDRIKENLDVFDFKLTQTEMTALDELGNPGKSALPFWTKLIR